MPINQPQVETLVSLANPINMSGRKTWVLDGGNFQTACWWFKKITGVEFNLLEKVTNPDTHQPASVTAGPQMRVSPDGFLFLTVEDEGLGASITLRGGSSTTLDGAWVPPQNTAPRSPAYGQPAMRYQDFEHRDLTKVPVKVKNKDVNWEDILTGEANPHTSVPTIEIQNAQKLTQVKLFMPFASKPKVIAEIKFTTRANQTTVTIK